MIEPIEASLLVFVVASAFATAFLRDVLGSIIAFSTYSLAVAVVWVFLRAPDVGLTEAAVGAGVMTMLFLVTIAKTTRPSDERTFERVDYRAAAIALVLVVALSTTLFALPPVGASDSAVITDDVTTYYLGNAYDETGVQNAVTAVLAAYRSFDTLGEAAVVYAAGVSLLLVLGKEVFE